MDKQTCIQTFIDCHRIFLETAIYCLQKSGKQAEASHPRLLFDCAQICQTSVDSVIRSSDLHSQTCAVCAEVCETCTEDSESICGEQQMKRCAETCRRRADICHEMLWAA